MDVLGKIIDEAVDGTTDLSSILRKCLVLATRLKNEKLKQWVLSELNGYDDKANLPPYRVGHVESVGTFLGSFNRQLNNTPLPSIVLKEQHREFADTAYYMQPIAAYEQSAQADTGTFQVAWPANIVALYQDKFFPDDQMALNRAHQVIPKTAITGLVSTVRNKLLEFALELQGEVGDAEPSPSNISSAKVEGMVTNIILGGQTNVFGGSVHGDIIQGVNQTVVKGDFASLSQALERIGVPTNELGQLQAALNEDGPRQDASSIGAKTNEWITKVTKGGLRVAGKVAEQVVVAAVRTYIGI